MSAEWAGVIALGAVALGCLVLAWRAMAVARDVGGINIRSQERERRDAWTRIERIIEKFLSPEAVLRFHAQERLNQTQADVAIEKNGQPRAPVRPTARDEYCTVEEALSEQ